MVECIGVVHRKIDVGKYAIFLNEEKVGEVFKEWDGGGSYRWSHSEVPDKDVVEGKNWKTRRKATINLLIEHIFVGRTEEQKMLEVLWNA